MPLETLRPNSTIQNGDDTSVVPSGTRQSVTADNDDATYVLFSVQQPAGLGMRLGCEAMTTLTSGQRIKQYRLRLRQQAHIIESIAPGKAVCNASMQLDKWPSAVLPGIDPGTSVFTTSPSTGWVRPSNVPTIAAATEIVNDAEFHCRLVDDGRNENDETPIPEEGWEVKALYFDVDVRDRPDVTDLEVRDAAGTDRCGGTVTDTTRPLVVLTGEYGYDGAPGQSVTVTQQWRVFSAAQVATTGFEAWEDGPWGEPRMSSHATTSRNQNGDSFTTGTSWGRMDPIENGSWQVFARFGTHDFIGVDGDIWWANDSTCAWTQNFPVPTAPTVSATAIDCPPSVELTIGAPSSSFTGTIWAEVQRSLSGGDSWIRLVNWTDDPVVPEGGSVVFTDRFVQVSYPEGSDCGAGEARTRELLYRVRLWGTVSGAFAYTAWTEIGDPVTVDPCVVAGVSCPTWLIHPTDADLDWVGTAEVWPWSTGWPYAPSQPAAGGLPHVVTGRPGGRDHTVSFITLSTESTLELVETLGEPMVWLNIADPTLPAIWVTAGPAVTAEPVQIASDDGAIHRVTATFREVRRPGVEGPPPEAIE